MRFQISEEYREKERKPEGPLLIFVYEKPDLADNKEFSIQKRLLFGEEKAPFYIRFQLITKVLRYFMWVD